MTTMWEKSKLNYEERGQKMIIKSMINEGSGVARHDGGMHGVRLRLC